MNGDQDPLLCYKKADIRYDLIHLMPLSSTNVLELGCGVGRPAWRLEKKWDAK